jgi:hypothetical protein
MNIWAASMRRMSGSEPIPPLSNIEFELSIESITSKLAPLPTAVAFRTSTPNSKQLRQLSNATTVRLIKHPRRMRRHQSP